MEKLRQIGLRLTPQRLAILEYLVDNKSHPSAEDIYKVVSKKFPTISFATVYNTLDALKKRGNIFELTIDPFKKRFDPNPKPHHHLICIRCLKIVDIHIKFRLNLAKTDAQGYEIVSNHVEFYGLCPKCKRKKHLNRNPTRPHSHI